MSGSGRIRLLEMGLACTLVMATAWAQDTSSTSTTQSGPANVTTEVRSGEVLYVSGNDLVVKVDDGQVKHFVVPESTKFNVDGKDLSVHDLQPGMKLTRTMVTTSVPKTVRTVRTITGTVWHVNAPSTVILTLEDGKNKEYKVPKGQTFEMAGQTYDVFSLRKGMKINATVVTESPLVETSSTRALTGQAPPPPPETPPATGALLIEQVATVAPPAQEVAQTTLPKTGSLVPLIGLIGLLSLAASLCIRVARP